MKALNFPRSLLPVMLLWAVCSMSQVQAEVKAVKLCGRDFIRAVVYTCGGSRWRRMLSLQNMEEFRNEEQNSIEDLSDREGLDLFARDLGELSKMGRYNTCCRNGCDLSLLC